jgi:hypothetical protein
MKMRTILLGIALMLGYTSGADAAEILSGGAIFAGPTQKVAVCYFYNSGNSSVTLKNFAITDPGGVSVPFTVNECGPSPATLAPRKSCGIARNVDAALPYVCKVVVAPEKTNVRGVLELRDQNQVVLQNIELR